MRCRLLAALLVLSPIIAFAQTKAPSIEGVWQITSVVTTGAGAVNIPKAQPGLVTFAKSRYSWVSVNTPAPRAKVAPVRDPNKLTDAEKIARFDQWGPFTGNAGTYQISGTTITRRPTVAKNEAVMTTDPPLVAQFRIEGTRLTMVAKSPTGQPASETTVTLTRVE
jgi:hypothetical protein